MNEANTLEFDGVRYPDGHASDPRTLGWMLGAPPPADKLVTFASDAFLDFPQIRWSLAHMRELAFVRFPAILDYLKCYDPTRWGVLAVRA